MRLPVRTPAGAACEVARAAVVTHREEREELSGLKRLPVPFLCLNLNIMEMSYNGGGG